MDRTIAFLAVGIIGCAGRNLPAWTAAQTGCPAEEVVIMSEDKVWSTESWSARCRGKTYACTERNVGQANAVVECKEQADEAPQVPDPTPRLCHFDTECTGDRRCQDGRCVKAATGP